MTANRSPHIFYGYIVLVAAFCIVAIAGGIWAIFGVFFEPMLTDFGWTRAELSVASSLSILFLTLFGIAGGKFTDRFGARLYVTACGLFLGLGFFLMSRVNAIWQVYLVYGVVIGVGMSGFWVPMMATVARWFVRRRGMMVGIVLAGGGVGITIMPPLVARLISAVGWRISYTCVGLITMIIVILAAQFLRRDPAQAGQFPDGVDETGTELSGLQAEGFSLRQAIGTRGFWMLCAIFSCLWFSANAVWVHIVIHAIDSGIPATSASSIPAVMGGVGIVARIIMGTAADKIGFKATLLIGFALMAVSLLWLLVARELWAFYLFAVGFGFGFAGLAVLESPLVARLFGLTSLGVILGSMEFVSTVFGVTSPIIVGYIFDIMGSYQLAFLICAAVSGVGLVLALLLRSMRKEEANDSGRST